MDKNFISFLLSKEAAELVKSNILRSYSKVLLYVEILSMYEDSILYLQKNHLDIISKIESSNINTASQVFELYDGKIHTMCKVIDETTSLEDVTDFLSDLLLLQPMVTRLETTLNSENIIQPDRRIVCKITDVSVFVRGKDNHTGVDGTYRVEDFIKIILRR